MRTSIHYEPSDDVSSTLAAADPMLGVLIERVGAVSLTAPPDAFVALVRSVVGQQLSERAARAIFGRLSSSVDLTPLGVASAGDVTLRDAGLSRQKASYIQEIARRFLTGEFEPVKLDGLTDAEVSAELMHLRGVGPWTAEMFLIFALQRPDVLAINDLGVRTQAGEMMGLSRPASREELIRRGELWKPHRSAASVYLMAARARSGGVS